MGSPPLLLLPLALLAGWSGRAGATPAGEVGFPSGNLLGAPAFDARLAYGGKLLPPDKQRADQGYVYEKPPQPFTYPTRPTTTARPATYTTPKPASYLPPVTTTTTVRPYTYTTPKVSYLPPSTTTTTARPYTYTTPKPVSYLPPRTTTTTPRPITYTTRKAVSYLPPVTTTTARPYTYTTPKPVSYLPPRTTTTTPRPITYTTRKAVSYLPPVTTTTARPFTYTTPKAVSYLPPVTSTTARPFTYTVPTTTARPYTYPSTTTTTRPFTYSTTSKPVSYLPPVTTRRPVTFSTTTPKPITYTYPTTTRRPITYTTTARPVTYTTRPTYATTGYTTQSPRITFTYPTRPPTTTTTRRPTFTTPRPTPPPTPVRTAPPVTGYSYPSPSVTFTYPTRQPTTVTTTTAKPSTYTTTTSRPSTYSTFRTTGYPTVSPSVTFTYPTRPTTTTSRPYTFTTTTRRPTFTTPRPTYSTTTLRPVTFTTRQPTVFTGYQKESPSRPFTYPTTQRPFTYSTTTVRPTFTTTTTRRPTTTFRPTTIYTTRLTTTTLRPYTFTTTTQRPTFTTRTTPKISGYPKETPSKPFTYPTQPPTTTTLRPYTYTTTTTLRPVTFTTTTPRPTFTTPRPTYTTIRYTYTTPRPTYTTQRPVTYPSTQTIFTGYPKESPSVPFTYPTPGAPARYQRQSAGQPFSYPGLIPGADFNLRLLKKRSAPVITEELLRKERADDGKYRPELHGGGRYEDDPRRWELRESVPGEPGADYPVYASIPRTAFSCSGRSEGYHADPETRCQVFHVCVGPSPVPKSSSLCPNGSVFNQDIATCDWWSNVDCPGSAVFRAGRPLLPIPEYSGNLLLPQAERLLSGPPGRPGFSQFTTSTSAAPKPAFATPPPSQRTSGAQAERLVSRPLGRPGSSRFTASKSAYAAPKTASTTPPPAQRTSGAQEEEGRLLLSTGLQPPMAAAPRLQQPQAPAGAVRQSVFSSSFVHTEGYLPPGNDRAAEVIIPTPGVSAGSSVRLSGTGPQKVGAPVLSFAPVSTSTTPRPVTLTEGPSPLSESGFSTTSPKPDVTVSTTPSPVPSQPPRPTEEYTAYPPSIAYSVSTSEDIALVSSTPSPLPVTSPATVEAFIPSSTPAPSFYTTVSPLVLNSVSAPAPGFTQTVVSSTPYPISNGSPESLQELRISSPEQRLNDILLSSTPVPPPPIYFTGNGVVGAKSVDSGYLGLSVKPTTDDNTIVSDLSVSSTPAPPAVKYFSGTGTISSPAPPFSTYFSGIGTTETSGGLLSSTPAPPPPISFTGNRRVGTEIVDSGHLGLSVKPTTDDDTIVSDLNVSSTPAPPPVKYFSGTETISSPAPPFSTYFSGIGTTESSGGLLSSTPAPPPPIFFTGNRRVGTEIVDSGHLGLSVKPTTDDTIVSDLSVSTTPAPSPVKYFSGTGTTSSPAPPLSKYFSGIGTTENSGGLLSSTPAPPPPIFFTGNRRVGTEVEDSGHLGLSVKPTTADDTIVSDFKVSSTPASTPAKYFSEIGTSVSGDILLSSSPAPPSSKYFSAIGTTETSGGLLSSTPAPPPPISFTGNRRFGTEIEDSGHLGLSVKPTTADDTNVSDFKVSSTPTSQPAKYFSEIGTSVSGDILLSSTPAPPLSRYFSVTGTNETSDVLLSSTPAPPPSIYSTGNRPSEIVDSRYVGFSAKPTTAGDTIIGDSQQSSTPVPPSLKYFPGTGTTGSGNTGSAAVTASTTPRTFGDTVFSAVPTTRGGPPTGLPDVLAINDAAQSTAAQKPYSSPSLPPLAILGRERVSSLNRFVSFRPSPAISDLLLPYNFVSSTPSPFSPEGTSAVSSGGSGQPVTTPATLVYTEHSLVVPSSDSPPQTNSLPNLPVAVEHNFRTFPQSPSEPKSAVPTFRYGQSLSGKYSPSIPEQSLSPGPQVSKQVTGGSSVVISSSQSLFDSQISNKLADALQQFSLSPVKSQSLAIQDGSSTRPSETSGYFAVSDQLSTSKQQGRVSVQILSSPESTSVSPVDGSYSTGGSVPSGGSGGPQDVEVVASLPAYVPPAAADRPFASEQDQPPPSTPAPFRPAGGLRVVVPDTLYGEPVGGRPPQPSPDVDRPPFLVPSISFSFDTPQGRQEFEAAVAAGLLGSSKR